MSDFFDGEVVEPTVSTTANIEFQLNKFEEGEYLLEKHIPDKCIFATPDIIYKFKNCYNNNVDIPILVYGDKGIGKLTCIIGLINNIPCYLPDIENDKKINNVKYFKILDADYNKILFYENVFYLNIEVLNNHTDILNYLKYIYQLAKASNINIYNDVCNDMFNDDNYDENNELKPKTKKINEKKIIIITHIDKCNLESQHYIAFMLDKINTYVNYIFTSYNTNSIDKKIISSCTNLNFNKLDETNFIKIFKTNFKTIFANQNHIFTGPMLKQLYNIYITNKYNIGNTISQIKYHLATEGITFLKSKTNNQSLLSLMSRIAHNFIRKKLVLSNVASALDIRKFLYILSSLNIKLIIFVKEVVKQLIKSKLKENTKTIILEKSAQLSSELNTSNKEVVIVEAFFYDIINVIYSPNYTEIKSK